MIIYYLKLYLVTLVSFFARAFLAEEIVEIYQYRND